MDFYRIMEFIGGSRLIQSAIILAAAVIVDRVLIGKLVRLLSKTAESRSPDNAPKLRTLFSVARTSLMIIIYFIAAVFIIQILFNVNASSVIAATGVLGVIAGLGAQSIVKDSISGAFILLENQYAVGDLVTVNDFTGYVESVTIRTTVIKGFEGDRLIIPNGNMTYIINHNRAEKAALVSVHISGGESVDRALEIIRGAVKDARADMSELTEDVAVLGVDELGPTAVKILLLARCETGTQYTVKRELLRRIKNALDENGIRLPFEPEDKHSRV